MRDYIIGRNPVLEALESEMQVEKIYILKGELKGSIHKIIGKAKSKGIIIQEVDKQKLDKMAEGSQHQGVAALVTEFRYDTLEDILMAVKSKGEKPFLVLLDEIEDPQNLGSIIRTCEVAGVHGVILPKRRSATITQAVHKASAGATNHMRVAKVTNLAETIDHLKERNIWIFGADSHGEILYTQADLTGAVALVIGNEGKGLSRLVRERCDVLIRLPMFGKIQSLNASNAAAILIYEVIRQNDGKR